MWNSSSSSECAEILIVWPVIFPLASSGNKARDAYEGLKSSGHYAFIPSVSSLSWYGGSMTN